MLSKYKYYISIFNKHEKVKTQFTIKKCLGNSSMMCIYATTASV